MIAADYTPAIDVAAYERDGADARAHGYGLDRNPHVWTADRGPELASHQIKREAWARGWEGFNPKTLTFSIEESDDGGPWQWQGRTAEGERAARALLASIRATYAAWAGAGQSVTRIRAVAYDLDGRRLQTIH